ncbi:unnamed protein product [Lactuca virosa]|uniref:Uncharacterized protein n=1 Tax=Lactuca virosa TaxID=75947 RepID=A0AAU9PT98_9ASTR|nr:unnamed protein product [Lactuca virosa]
MSFEKVEGHIFNLSTVKVCKLNKIDPKVKIAILITFPFEYTCLLITRTTKPSPLADDASVFGQRRLRLRSPVDDTDEVSYSGLQPLPPPPSLTLFTGLLQGLKKTKTNKSRLCPMTWIFPKCNQQLSD